MQPEKVAVVPHCGEFGWFLLHHVRAVHRMVLPPGSSKIVCCRAGHELYFPTATGFFTDWVNPVPENERSGDGRGHYAGCPQRFPEIEAKLQASFPDHRIVSPPYDCHWHTSDLAEACPVLKAPAKLTPVDIAVGARLRSFDSPRNWPHWNWLIERITAKSWAVGLIGVPETIESCPGATVRAWDHPDGPDAGSIDLLSRCKLFIGCPSGTSFLASLMHVPSLIVCNPERERDNQGGPLIRGNLNETFHTHEWKNPNDVLRRTYEFMRTGAWRKS